MNINYFAKKSLFQITSTILAPQILFSFAYLRAKPNKKFQVKFNDWKIVRGDIIKVRTGKDKGKISQVVKVIRKANQVICKDVNVKLQPEVDKAAGQMIQKLKQMPIHVSNVGLYEKQVNKAVRIRFAYNAQTGERLRISKATGKIIPKPKYPELTRQNRGKSRMRAQKDTAAQLAHKVTYEGEDFKAIREQFNKFISQKEQRQKYLVFKQ